MSHRFSYWEKEVFLEPYDLVVVGAGIVGLSTALFYMQQRPGCRTLILEKGFLPEGASTRNAGFACVGSIGEHLSDLNESSQKEVGRRIRMRYEGLQLLRDTLGEDAIAYDPCGGYELFTEKGPFEQARKHISDFNAWMKQLVDEEEVYRAGELNGYKVIHNRLEGALHPGRLMNRLLKRVTRQGADIRWSSPVDTVDASGRVRLVDGLTVEAEKVLVAANGFARTLLPEAGVTPARGYVFVTNPLRDLQWRGTFHHDRGFIYFRDVGNRLLLGGARHMDEQAERTDRFGTNPDIKDHLKAFAARILHLEEGWQIAHEWSGIMGFTETKTPLLQRVDGSLYVAAGLSGMGIAIGMEIGKRAAALLNEGPVSKGKP